MALSTTITTSFEIKNLDPLSRRQECIVDVVVVVVVVSIPQMPIIALFKVLHCITSFGNP